MMILQKKIIPSGEKPKGFERKDVRKMFREFSASKDRGNAELSNMLVKRKIDITDEKKAEIATCLEEVAPKESAIRLWRNLWLVITPILASLAAVLQYASDIAASALFILGAIASLIGVIDKSVIHKNILKRVAKEINEKISGKNVEDSAGAAKTVQQSVNQKIN